MAESVTKSTHLVASEAGPQVLLAGLKGEDESIMWDKKKRYRWSETHVHYV